MRHGLAAIGLAAFCLLAMTGRGLAANALCPAAAEGDINALRQLLTRNPDLINQYGAEGVMPLHAAAQNGRRNAVLLLIAAGADINAREKETGMTPLLMAVIGNHPGVVQALASQGADVNAAANQGATPLHMAAYLGQRGIVEYLMARGADINAVNQAGLTPIEWALSNNQREVASVLAAAGARLPEQAPAPGIATPPIQDTNGVPGATEVVAPTPEASLQMEIEEAAQWIADLQMQLNQTRATLQTVREQLTAEIATGRQATTNLATELQKACADVELYRKRYEAAVLEKLDSDEKWRDEIAQTRRINDEMLTQLTAKLNESQTQLAESDRRRHTAEKKADSLEADLISTKEHAAQALDAARRECAQKLLAAEQESVRLKERILRMGANLQEISRRLRERESKTSAMHPLHD